jgi:hypothetical protein
MPHPYREVLGMILPEIRGAGGKIRIPTIVWSGRTEVLGTTFIACSQMKYREASAVLFLLVVAWTSSLS